MSQLGVGVMISRLSGNKDSVAAYKDSLGKEIASVAIENEDSLVFKFTDGTGLIISDEGQSCCESRYMRTDDDLPYYVGATLMEAEIQDAPNQPDEYGEHEVQFLRVTTSKGVFVVSTHNEHNGYYGGFAITCSKQANQ